jgi:hypothetical protein
MVRASNTASTDFFIVSNSSRGFSVSGILLLLRFVLHFNAMQKK